MNCLQLLVSLGFKLALIFCRANGFDYCEITCNGTEHTLCSHSQGGGQSCLNNEQVYLTLEDKRWILELHNNLRQRVAMGLVDGGSGRFQPPAGNMMKMVWDSEVALIAKRWADQCDRPEHDKCRITMDGNHLGQNVRMGEFRLSGNENDFHRYKRIEQVTLAWSIEVANLKSEHIQRYNPRTAGNTTHYTQMVWANSIFLGCGYTEFRLPNNLVKFRFVCNYKPPGNQPFEGIYRRGPPCSTCSPRQICSETWKGLCWDGSNNTFSDTVFSSGLKASLSHDLVYLCLIVYYAVGI